MLYCFKALSVNVFFRLIVGPKCSQATEKRLTGCWRRSSVCDAKAASSAKSIPRMRTEVTFVFARRRAMLNSRPSALVCIRTPSLQVLKACWRSNEKKMPKSVGASTQPCSVTPLKNGKEFEVDLSKQTLLCMFSWKSAILHYLWVKR